MQLLHGTNRVRNPESSKPRGIKFNWVLSRHNARVLRLLLVEFVTVE